MKFVKIPPPDCLKGYIRFYWTLESNDVAMLPKTLGPLADGCPGLIFQPAWEGIFYDHSDKPLPEIFLYGQTIRRTAIYLMGKFKTLGISFFPHTLKSIFGFNASELTDSCLDVDLVFLHISEQLLNTTSPADQINILSFNVLSQIRRTGVQKDIITGYALNQIIESKGRIALKDLQKSLNISERYFERKFNQHVGISPKLFSKVCRFQASLNQLKSSHYAKLSDIAFDNGYADQSHFIRTFKEFAGFPPYQFQKQAHLVAEDFPVLMK
jgi:AraC-like DNA-binding protein